MEKTPQYHVPVTVTTALGEVLGKILAAYPDDKLFLVTEEHCAQWCIPPIADTPGFSKLKQVVIPSGEENKKLSSVEQIWLFLSQNGADRKSLVVNLGGGMLTDLGSFAASTFKRGCDFVNIPTTLLAQVDASVGGKTGFNFNGLKNEIGVINQPNHVLIDTRFLQTIDHPNFLSGYAEMIKHGLIFSTDHLEEVRRFDLIQPDLKILSGMIARSVAIKDYFVDKDPNERNIRKALNFGHTIGHAFESYAMETGKPILHGFAVAYGMMAELWLSHRECGFPKAEMVQLIEWLKSIYGKFEVAENDYAALFELMTHDKKNEGKRINFTLLPGAGRFEINCNCGRERVYEALDFYQNI